MLVSQWREVGRFWRQRDTKLRYSGYPKGFRKSVIKTAIGIYREKLEKSRMEGGTPLYRDREWERDRRDRDKEEKQAKWYQSRNGDGIQNLAPLILDPTEGGAMRKEMDKVCELFKQAHGIGIKIMERGGRKASSDIRSDPMGSKLCKKTDCQICTAPGSKGGCLGISVGYRQICRECPYSRGNESESSI